MRELSYLCERKLAFEMFKVAHTLLMTGDVHILK